MNQNNIILILILISILVAFYAIYLAMENSNLEKQDFSSLDGKNIVIILSNTSTVINIKISDETIILQENHEEEIDLSLEGSPIAFINYFNKIDTDSSIKISGAASLAENFSNLASKINIDWEQIIADYTNDDIAYYSVKISESLKQKSNEVKESITRNLKEYIRDETDIIPSKESINSYIRDVDTLRNKIEMIDAKLKRVK